MTKESDEQRVIRLQAYDGEKAFRRGIDWPETPAMETRSERVTSHYQGMFAVYSVSLFDEWYGPHWLATLTSLPPNAGYDSSFDNIRGGPIKEIGDCLKGVRVVFAHSMGRICALADATARNRVITAASLLNSARIDNTECPQCLSCPKHGGTHSRLILGGGAMDEIKWMVRRVFLALNPGLKEELIKKPIGA